MKVVFSDRAYAAVMAETTEKIATETGGLFLGIYDRDIWYVIETIDPGPNSIFEVAYFEYDQKYTQHLINKIANLYEERLTLIGLWHRHPGSFDVFSMTDNGTNSKYASMRPAGAISGLVNIDPKFRLTMYHVGRPCRYSRISYVVGDHLIPEKYLRFKSTEHYEKLMQNIMRREEELDGYGAFARLDHFMNFIEPYYQDRLVEEDIRKPGMDSDELQEMLIENVVKDLSFLSDEIGVQMSVISSEGRIILSQDTPDGTEKVTFGYHEGRASLIFWHNGEKYIYEQGLFEDLYYMAKEAANEQEAKRPRSLVEPETRNILTSLAQLIRLNKNEDE
ncbi:MAG: Mov34/MPN/PAD-1 family protein [Lachnospiraceae bacterium]|nr:Mov34/MPN/PAD-1 family protein [Lachnospiraceae bacterium]